MKGKRHSLKRKNGIVDNVLCDVMIMDYKEFPFGFIDECTIHVFYDKLPAHNYNTFLAMVMVRSIG